MNPIFCDRAPKGYLCFRQHGHEGECYCAKRAESDPTVIEAFVESILNAPKCKNPPAGWRCSREAGHSGPCAATKIVNSSIGSICQTSEPLTVRQLKELISDWPEVDRDGEPTEVWIETAPNVSNFVIRALPLNVREREDGVKAADLLLI